jgi:hypothetical protein
MVHLQQVAAAQPKQWWLLADDALCNGCFQPAARCDLIGLFGSREQWNQGCPHHYEADWQGTCRSSHDVCMACKFFCMRCLLACSWCWLLLLKHDAGSSSAAIRRMPWATMQRLVVSVGCAAPLHTWEAKHSPCMYLLYSGQLQARGVCSHTLYVHCMATLCLLFTCAMLQVCWYAVTVHHALVSPKRGLICTAPYGMVAGG